MARSYGTFIRHSFAPLANGCRWCGTMSQDHKIRWVPGHKWHSWACPTDAQRLARMQAHRMERFIVGSGAVR